MQIFLEKADKFIKLFLRVLAGGMVLYLLLLSMFSTSGVELRNFSGTLEEDLSSYNYYLADSWQVCLLVLVVTAAAAWLARRRLHDAFWEGLEKYRWLLYLLFLTAGLLFIGFTRLRPVSDPGKVLEIAEGMVAGDFTQFMPNDGYLWRCPHQMGIVFLCWCLTIVFGKWNYLAFQVLNLLLLIWGLELAGSMAGLLWPENGARIHWSIRLVYVLFVPYFLYVTFIYGTIPAFIFSLAAMYMELRFIREKRWSFGVSAAIFIALAIVVKPNSRIMLVAMLIFLIYDLVMEKKKLRTFAVIVIAVSLQAVCMQGVDSFMSWKSGYPVSGGQAMLGYVAMGLQESRFGPGAYNGHGVSLYEEAGYDTAGATRLAWQSIQDSLERFSDDKSEAVRWLGRKIASQWNEPAFGSIEVNRGREGAVKLPAFLDSIINGAVGYGILLYLNYFQSVILAGGVLYFLLADRKKSRDRLLLIVTVIGGFIFHIFWEAKSQYVFPYFLLIFPYSVRGWEELAGRMEGLFGKLKNGQKISMKKAAICAGATVACIALMAVSYHTRVFQYMIAVQDEPALQEEYWQAVEEKCGVYNREQN